MFFDRLRQYQYTNTRQYLRLPASWPVKCKPRTEGSPPMVTQTKDISAGGVRVISPRNTGSEGVTLVSPQSFSVGTLLDLEIYVLPLSRTVSAGGQVVRSVPSKEGRFELGIRFIEINPKDQAELNEAVERLSPHRDRRRFGLSWWRKIS